MLNVISLGAGVQSSTMALMAAHGEITPMPACAIFADTGDEPAAVYEWLSWLETQLPFPVRRVSAGVLSEAAARLRTSKKSGNTYLSPGIPAFFERNGERGIGARQCTRTFKIDVINREIRKMRTKGQKVICWVGISRDEASRMKPARAPYVENIWPLVDRKITRADCLTWMAAKGYPTPPRSACVYCPFHSDEEWLRLKTQAPEEFERAVRFEKTYQASAKAATALDGTPWLHDSRKPLESVDFAALVQDRSRQLNMFNNECEGMCGV